MNVHRPTFRGTAPARIGTTILTPQDGMSSIRQPYHRPAQLFPTMRLIRKPRNINQSRQAMVSLNQLDAQIIPQVPPTELEPDLFKTKLKREDFKDFNSRMMKTSSEEALVLGPEIHAALLNMANGIEPVMVMGEQEERKRQLQRKLVEKTGSFLTTMDDEPRGQSDTELESDAYESTASLDNMTNSRPVLVNHEPPFVSTFGTGLGRTSLIDLESFQTKKHLWKATMKSTLNYIRENAARKRGSEVGVSQKEIDLNFGHKKRPVQGQVDEVTMSDNETKVKIIADLDRVLQRGSMLLMASSALKSKIPKEKEKVKLENNELKYTPPSKSFLDKANEGLLKLPIYDRIKLKREKSLKQPFNINNFEENFENRIENVAKGLKKFSVSSTFGDKTKPFDGLQISSLVGTNVAEIQGFRQKNLDKRDTMNHLQLRLVQGLQDAELSSFLENHGRRQQEIGMQIIPGNAPDPGILETLKKRKETKYPIPLTKQLYKETSFNEPKFHRLRQDMLNHFTEEFSSTSRYQSQEASGVKIFPNFGYSLKLDSKMNSYINKDSLTNSILNQRVENNHSKTQKPEIRSFNGIGLNDASKSEFARELRKHGFQEKSKSKLKKGKSFDKK